MKLRGNKTPVFSCIQPLGTPQIAVFFLFCVRFWHFLVFSVEESKQKNSKHRKRVPTSVNPRCDADAPDGDFACWEVSQTLFCGGLHPLKIFKNIWQKCGRTRSRPCSQKMQLMTLPQRKEVFHYGKFTGHRKGLSRRA